MSKVSQLLARRAATQAAFIEAKKAQDAFYVASGLQAHDSEWEEFTRAYNDPDYDMPESEARDWRNALQKAEARLATAREWWGDQGAAVRTHYEGLREVDYELGALALRDEDLRRALFQAGAIEADREGVARVSFHRSGVVVYAR